MPGRSKSKTARREAPRARAQRARIAVVWAEFNKDLTAEMRDRAIAAVKHYGYEPAPVVAVAGTYDLPFAVDRVLADTSVVAAVAIGVIVTGETKHDEVIAHATAKTLQEIALTHGKPVGLGVTGPGQNYRQAKARVDRADAAVDAVILLLKAQ